MLKISFQKNKNFMKAKNDIFAFASTNLLIISCENKIFLPNGMENLQQGYINGGFIVSTFFFYLLPDRRK